MRTEPAPTGDVCWFAACLLVFPMTLFRAPCSCSGSPRWESLPRGGGAAPGRWVPTGADVSRGRWSHAERLSPPARPQAHCHHVCPAVDQTSFRTGPQGPNQQPRKNTPRPAQGLPAPPPPPRGLHRRHTNPLGAGRGPSGGSLTEAQPPGPSESQGDEGSALSAWRLPESARWGRWNSRSKNRVGSTFN